MSLLPSVVRLLGICRGLGIAAALCCLHPLAVRIHSTDRPTVPRSRPHGRAQLPITSLAFHGQLIDATHQMLRVAAPTKNDGLRV